MKRRKFINNIALGTTSFAAGLAAYYYFGDDALKVIEGEEWRNDRQVNRSDLDGLLSDEEVLEKAQQSIDAVRKVEVKLQLRTHENQPITQQKISIEQISHHMDWGFSHGGIFNDLETLEGRKRGEHISKLFNYTTAKCYWNERWHQPIEKRKGVRIYELFDQEIKWAEALGMKVKGHPLVWTVEKSIPTWLFKEPYEKQVEYLKAHVQSLVEFGGNRVSKWDLCNEMLWEPAFENIAKRHWPHIDPIDDIADYIAEALQWARSINPNATYSLNDYGLVLTYIKDISAKQQRNRYVKLIEALRDRNALPDAVGSQAHIGGKFPLAAFNRMVNDLSKSGLPVQITEFWSKVDDFPKNLFKVEKEKAMADYISNIYTLAFAHPAINHFTFWGSSQFFSPQGEVKAPYVALDKLINHTWKTKLALESDASGQIAFRGFKGKYLVKIGNEHHELEIKAPTQQILTLKG